MFKRYLWNGS